MIIGIMNFLDLLSLMLSKPEGLPYMLKYHSIVGPNVGQGFSLARDNVGQGFSLAEKEVLR